MSSLTMGHWAPLEQILCNFRATLGHKNLYKDHEKEKGILKTKGRKQIADHTKIQFFSNADWAKFREDRRLI